MCSEQFTFNVFYWLLQCDYQSHVYRVIYLSKSESSFKAVEGKFVLWIFLRKVPPM